MISRRTLLQVALAGPLTTALQAVHAQATPWPEAAVRIVVPFGTGGAADVMTRVLAEKLQARLGQTFSVENRAGAGGNLGMEAVRNAPHDGYTIASASVGTLSINQFLYAKMGYDAAKDFVAVSMIFENCNIFIVAAQHPAKTVLEFVAWARQRPKGVSYGSAGIGTTPHLAGELFRMRTGLETLHIPFRGVAQSMPALLSGDTDFAIENIASYMPMLRAGKVRALAVTSAQRWPTLPDVPTMAEAGVSDFVITSWGSFVMPKDTPAPIVAKLSAAIQAIQGEPAMQQRFLEIGARAISSTPQEATAFAERERVKWKAIVQASGAKME